MANHLRADSGLRAPLRGFHGVMLVAIALWAVPASLSATEVIAHYMGGSVNPNLVADGVAASDFGLSPSSELYGFTALASGGNPGFAFEATGGPSPPILIPIPPLFSRWNPRPSI